jgi:hypothetical protein
MLYAPFLATDSCRPSSPPRRSTNRFALLLFTVTATAGLLLKYLP